MFGKLLKSAKEVSATVQTVQQGLQQAGINVDLGNVFPQYHPEAQHNAQVPPEVQNYQQDLANQQRSGQFQHTRDGENISLSSCLGKKKALFVGINYFGQQGELRGCINDVKNISNFVFQYYGFSQQNSVILTDDNQNPKYKPTKANIIEAMKWLVQGATAGDSLFFHYSGHGGSVKDTTGDEHDGFDETIIPIDYQQAGFILDDEMYELLVKGLPQGVRMTTIFDSCHSGTALDLPFTYKVDGEKGEVRMFDNRLEAGKAFAFAGLALFQGNTAGALAKAKEGLSFLMKPQQQPQQQQQQQQQTQQPAQGQAGTSGSLQSQSQTPVRTNADVLQWGGCMDSQTSADAHIGGQATGAMSYAFIKVLSANRNITYSNLLLETRQVLKTGGFTQVPQLSTGNNMNLDVPFIM
eukprot:TRINITY_DN2863_c0_g1_i1.p1 TRINITY_DN2863_c0_g1~~TRINITY_DN2863_c0_g1_i1.p1  ORF type:complete len:425 (+),score=120.00 TRINITY_DN2863_c0_g1_i1:48-1277(+)